MKYKRLLGVLLAAFLLSCFLSLMMETLHPTYRPEQTHLEWLRFPLALATLPGEFVAMMMKGMCNTRSPGGIAIKTLVNTVFYFVPVLVVAAVVEMEVRKRKARKAAESGADLVGPRRG